MSDLTDFLLARIAEDEAVARTAGEPPWDEWCYDDGGEVYHAETLRKDPDNRHYLNGVTCDTEGLSPAVDEDVGPHIARFDPARILAECEAKRRIVVQAEEASADRSSCISEFYVGAEERAQGYATDPGNLILRALASVYADHPDFDPAWRV